MHTRIHRYFAAAAIVTVAMLVLAPLGQASGQSPDERTVYVSVVGGNGAPVGGLTAGSFEVKEDNKVREITNVKYSSEPAYFVVLIDTTAGDSSSQRPLSTAMTYVQYTRDALKAFTNMVLAASPSSQIALMDFGGVAMVRQDFTSKLGDLEAAIPKFIPKESEAVFNEALVEAAKRLSQVPGRRRFIVTMNFEPSEEGSRMDGKFIAAQVQKSGATVWSVSVQTGKSREANRENLLKGLAASTGGLHVTIQTAVPLPQFMQSIAANTVAQYEVTFKHPAGDPMPKNTVVTANSPGARALNLVWAPDGK